MIHITDDDGCIEVATVVVEIFFDVEEGVSKGKLHFTAVPDVVRLLEMDSSQEEIQEAWLRTAHEIIEKNLEALGVDARDTEYPPLKDVLEQEEWNARRKKRSPPKKKRVKRPPDGG